MKIPQNRRSPIARARRAQAIKRYRNEDRKAYGLSDPPSSEGRYFTNSDLSHVNQNFRTDFERVARRLLGHAKRPIVVLDAGGGEGIFGFELSEKIGNENMELYGAGLTRPYHQKRGTIEGKTLAAKTTEPWKRFKEYRVGDFIQKADKWFQNGRFDLIVFNSTPLRSPDFLPLIARKLRVGGEAYYILRLGNPKAISKHAHSLKKTGCELIVLGKYQIVQNNRTIDFATVRIRRIR